MIERLHEKGKKLVLWQIPVFKGMEPGRVSEQLDMDKEYALEHGLLVMNKAGTPYEIPTGNWFEGSYLPDFTNVETKKFWFQKRKYLSVWKILHLMKKSWMDSRRTVESSYIPKK